MTTTISPQTTDLGRQPSTGEVTVTQYSRRGTMAIWAAAALPMGALSWIVAPAIADGSGIESLLKPLVACLTVGLIWQFVLVMALVGYEQRSLRWSRLREALWLRAPRSPRSGRVGGRVWLLVIPLALATGLEELISLPAPIERNFGEFLSSDAGAAMFDGAWGLFALFVTMSLFNTVLGEELLFRGLLLPRMHGAFGDKDWLANGLLFAVYHLHVPWAIPASVLDPFLYSLPAKRHRSALLSIAVHSVQSVMIGLMVLMVVV
jgi:membrane protease YdiL (CAAX protease family)